VLTRPTLLAFVLALTGCAEGAPPPPTTPRATTALPPEVELDPATATAKYQAAKKPRR
jgi:hypothetical protein